MMELKGLKVHKELKVHKVPFKVILVPKEQKDPKEHRVLKVLFKDTSERKEQQDLKGLKVHKVLSKVIQESLVPKVLKVLPELLRAV